MTCPDARIHSQTRYLDWFGEHLDAGDYDNACEEIAGDTSAAHYLCDADDGREEWIVFAGNRWVRAIWEEESGCIVTFKPLTEPALQLLYDVFAGGQKT